MSLESLESALSSQMTCGDLWSLLACLERAACCGGEPRRIDVRLPLFDATAQVLRATGFTFGPLVLVTRSKVAVLLSPPAEAQRSLAAAAVATAAMLRAAIACVEDALALRHDAFMTHVMQSTSVDSTGPCTTTVVGFQHLAVLCRASKKRRRSWP